MGPPFRPETPRFLQNEFQKLPCSGLPSRSRTESPPLDVRTDHAPLARPVLAYGLAAMDVATIHTVGPGDVIGEHGQHAVYIPRVKAIVNALQGVRHHHPLVLSLAWRTRCVRKLKSRWSNQIGR